MTENIVQEVDANSKFVHGWEVVRVVLTSGGCRPATDCELPATSQYT